MQQSQFALKWSQDLKRTMKKNMELGTRGAAKVIKNPRTFDLNSSILGSVFEAGAEEQDGQINVSHQVENLMEEKKKEREYEEGVEGSDLDLDLSLTQPGLFCNDNSPSSVSQSSCVSGDNSRLFEASTLVVMGCLRCHLYVMVSRQSSVCPKCSSCFLLDIFRPHSACNW